MAILIRSTIRVFLEKNGEMVQRSTFQKRSAACQFVEANKNSEWDTGRVQVVYSESKDYWNAAEFKNLYQLKSILTDFLDTKLIEEFA